MVTLVYRNHPLQPAPSQDATRLIRAYDERKRLAELGYTSDGATESTLLIEAFQVIESQVGRLRATDQKRRANKGHGEE